MKSLEEELKQKGAALSHHPIYQRLGNIPALQIFMSFHVYAVWDFMSLLKALQRQITCVEVPWRPSPYSKSMVRLINEIVLGEESDLGPDGAPIDHFSLYLAAMNEVGLDTTPVLKRVRTLDFSNLDPAITDFVNFNLELAQSRATHKICAAFFFGREQIIPDLFRPALAVVERELEAQQAFKYYLARHIELDGDEHGPMAMKCLSEVVGSSQELYTEALQTGIKSLELRTALWDAAVRAIDERRTVTL